MSFLATQRLKQAAERSHGRAVTPEAAAAEVMRRRRAREQLVDYAKLIEIPGAPLSEDPDDEDSWVFKPVETGLADHHRVTCEAIQRCIETPSGRLMIFEPPGSAKSTYASVVGVTWAMGKFPGLQVLGVSYAATPIIRHSKRARQIARSDQYQNLWKTTIQPGSNAADEWELTNGSRLFVAGLLGGITSTRCDLGVIDDPVANREDADSEVMRKKTRQEYEDSFLTRLKPNASIILIQTRWHEDDLAGSILPDGYDGRSGPVLCKDGQIWEVLCIPAQATRMDDPLGRKPGEMLWPEWFNDRHWANYRSNARTWNALFQQNPQPATGGQFEETMFHRFSLYEIVDPQTGQLPEEWTVFATGDWAVTEKMQDTNPDFTEFGVWALDTAGDLWLLAGWRGQLDIVKMLTEWWALTSQWWPNEWAIEGGPIRRAVEPLLKKFQEDLERAGKLERWTPLTYLPKVGDKTANATSFRGRAASRKVHVVKNPYGDHVIAQLCGFPFGRLDDAVDMCGLAGRLMDRWATPEKEDPEEKPKQPAPDTMQYLEFADQERQRAAKDYMR